MTALGSIEINGAALHYVERGTGTPLVLLHGGLASSAMWEPHLLGARHPDGDRHWQALLRGTAWMWLGYQGLTPDDLRRIDAPILVFVGDRDEMFPLDLMDSLYRALPNAELAVCPNADHFMPVTPDGAGPFATTIRDFAGRHSVARA